MHLNQFTDIAIRSLIYLAQPTQNNKITIDELSKKLNVSKNHLVKVIHFLSQKQWVITFRGKGGGVKINRQLDQCYIGDLIEILENHTDQSTELINCENPLCVLLPVCHLRPILNDALTHFYDYLNQYTLADVVKDYSIVTSICEEKDKLNNKK